jgi:hypothetical protein
VFFRTLLRTDFGVNDPLGLENILSRRITLRKTKRALINAKSGAVTCNPQDSTKRLICAFLHSSPTVDVADNITMVANSKCAVVHVMSA